MLVTFSEDDLIFHNLNQTLKVSFLDSVEELTELSSLNSDYKFKIIFLSKIIYHEKEVLLVIYKDLTCDVLSYDKKLREIKLIQRFMLMVEDDYLNMRYSVTSNLLIGWTDSILNIFDFNLENDLQNEKYVDRLIELKHIFGKNSKKLFFTNYFLENFPQVCKEYFVNINKPTVKFGKNYFDVDNDKKLNLSQDNFTYASDFKVTASLIWFHPLNKSIYQIVGTDTGKVIILDIFFNSEFNNNPIKILDYHVTRINLLNIYDNRILIVSSEDGIISFTDISNEKIENILKGQEEKEFSSSNLNKSISNKTIIQENSPPNLNLNYYYSKRKSLALDESKSFISLKKSATTESFFDDKNSSNIQGEELENKYTNSKYEAQSPINLLPTKTIKNYSKLKKIFPVIQIDTNNASFDDKSNKKNKTLIGFQLEDNSLLFMEVESLNLIFTFTSNQSKHEIKAVYHISYEKCLIIYLENNTIVVCNYLTKTADRIITDFNRIYNILKVEEKLKMYLLDSENIIQNNFKVNYEYTNEKERKTNTFNNEPSQNTTVINPSSSNNSNNTSGEQFSLKFIKDTLTDEKHKMLFLEKYYNSIYNKRKTFLNVTLNKFESAWIKKIEHLVIDEIVKIINSPSLNDKLKRIWIMNILYNPSIHSQINNRYENKTMGIENMYLNVGGQTNQFISINLEDYLVAVERLVHDGKNKYLSQNINLYNLISLFHIWNLSLDLDLKLIQYFKFSQPIFEVNFVLQGCDAAMSLLLNCEAETDGHLAGHNNFLSEYSKMDEEGRKLMKENKFCNKSFLVKSQQGYLTNFKNYKLSSTVSHLVNLSLFSSMITILGFEEMTDLCKIISSEKSLVKNLSLQKYSCFSNLNLIDKFLYDYIDDVTITNKDLLLLDYFNIKYNILKSSVVVSENEQISQTPFLIKLKRILNYLENLYDYVFERVDNKTIPFYKLNKESNVDNSKLSFISGFDLSLVNIVLTYNSLVEEKDKIDSNQILKITQLLILFVFKILNPLYVNFKTSFSKIIVELLSKSTNYLENIYKDNMTNWAKFLIELYTMVKIPIDLDGLFKKYEIGHCTIIKSEDNYNFLKIMLAKLLKNLSKTGISYILKIIVEEFKKKTPEYDYFSYLLEILWILFREKNSKYVNYLPPLVNVIMTAMSTLNKEMRHVCLDNAKKVLSCLLPNYPMISFHQNSQKLAVGANDGKVYIYDLTSGNIWKNLNAHTNEISAISFDYSGNILISYSSTEKIIGLTNFFSNFFSMKDGYYKSKNFPEIKEGIDEEEKFNIVKFQLMTKNDNKIVLIREDKSVEVLSL